MATYPDDAVFNLNTFPILGSVSYSDTGATKDFALASDASFPGEVLIFSDGILQEPGAYQLISNGSEVRFYTAPNATDLSVKTIVIPDRFQKIASIETIATVEYSNSSVTVVDSNDYIVDGVITAWALPDSAGTSINKDELLVAISGVTQLGTDYTFPSAVLDTEGIDIAPALSSNATLQIRALNISFNETVRCNSMQDRKPDKGFNETEEIEVSLFRSQAGYEKRRLLSRKFLRTWSLSYTNISGVERQSIKDFYRARSGSFESFRLDLDHLSQTGTTTVRFDSPIADTTNHILGDLESQKYYDVSFTLREIFD